MTDKRKYISAGQAIEVLFMVWSTVILISIFNMPPWLAGCVVTLGVAVSELHYGIKVDKENADNRKD